MVPGAARHRDRRGRAVVHAVRACGGVGTQPPAGGGPLTLLEVRGLEVTYPGGAAAVRGVDLRLGVAGGTSTPTLALRPRAVVSVL
ncbi:hypothetical protein AB0H86_16630, partial [Streptomyces sp. NPDC050997]